jgi:probable rRNA maturation factor
VSKPALRLSLQMPDSRHRQFLPRHRVARCLSLPLSGPAEITVRVVDAQEGRRLNRDFRAKDAPTNVLTFDYAREPVVVADIVLCSDVVEQEAEELGIPIADHYAHLLVHGCLHALGHDHQKVREAQRMERLETELLARIGVPDPYRKRDELT